MCILANCIAVIAFQTINVEGENIKNVVKEINNAVAIFDASWDKAIGLEGPLKSLLSRIRNDIPPDQWSRSATQFVTRMLDDIATLKKNKSGEFFSRPIQGLEKVIGGDRIFNELAGAKSPDELKDFLTNYENALSEIEKYFGPASTIEIMAFIKGQHIKKLSNLVGKNFSNESDFVENRFDYFFRKGWGSNLILELKMLRIICEPCNNKTWEKDYLSNINRLELLFNQVYEKDTQDDLEFFYYKIFLSFKRNDFLKACAIFEAIPRSWLVGSSKSNWWTIVKIYSTVSNCYQHLPGKEEASVDALECAFHFVLSRYSNRSEFGRKMLVQIGTDLHNKYIFHKKNLSALYLDGILEDLELTPPWKN